MGRCNEKRGAAGVAEAAKVALGAGEGKSVGAGEAVGGEKVGVTGAGCGAQAASSVRQSQKVRGRFKVSFF